MRAPNRSQDMLFALMMLGDDRAVRATYVAGSSRTSAAGWRGLRETGLREAHGA